MGKLPFASAAAIAISSLYYVDGFSSSRALWRTQLGRNDCTLLSSIHDDTNDENCHICSEYQSCGSEDRDTRKSQDLSCRNLNPIVHTSRRKFVQFVAASSAAAACSFAAYGIDFNHYTSSVSINNDIIAFPTGPLAPFSSTRQYRTIVLSNG